MFSAHKQHFHSLWSRTRSLNRFHSISFSAIRKWENAIFFLFCRESDAHACAQQFNCFAADAALLRCCGCCWWCLPQHTTTADAIGSLSESNLRSGHCLLPVTHDFIISLRSIRGTIFLIVKLKSFHFLTCIARRTISTRKMCSENNIYRTHVDQMKAFIIVQIRKIPVMISLIFVSMRMCTRIKLCEIDDKLRCKKKTEKSE